MLDLSKLSSYLLADLRARLSPSSLEDDRTADSEIAALTPESAFDHYCNYNGLINYSDNLIRTIDSLRAAETTIKSAGESIVRDFAFCFAIAGKVEWSSESAESLRKMNWQDLNDGEIDEVNDFIDNAVPGDLLQLRSIGVVIFKTVG